MIRILFVDDEQSVLDGLRRALRRLRGEWEMEFVDSGEQALGLLAGSPFDVIVSDMRMPTMNGAELLAKVHANWPRTARFVLSGYSELESVMRTVPVAHQFLTKPCEPAVIREAVERAMTLESLLQESRLGEIVGNIGSLPSLPTVYQAINEALADPSVSTERLSLIIEEDTAMTAKTLQLVNSSFFGIAQKIPDVQQAIAYLGLDTIRDLVLSLEVFRPPDASNETLERFLRDLQIHSTRIARLAAGFCPEKQTRPMHFTAGILHDIGSLVLATSLPEEFSSLLQESQETGAQLTALEQRQWGVHHGEVGAYLLGLWGLPYPILEAAAFHHQPTRTPQETPSPLATIHAADALLAAVGEDSVRGYREGGGLDLDYLDDLGLTAKLERWQEQAKASFEGEGS